MVTPSDQPAATTSSIAVCRRVRSRSNDAFMPKMIQSDPRADAAMSAPSMAWYGLCRRSVRSLKVPGSPSAAFTTTGVGSSGAR